MLALRNSNVNSYNINYCTAPSVISRTVLTWSNQTVDGEEIIVGAFWLRRLQMGQL
jgi:hypothetical protein